MVINLFPCLSELFIWFSKNRVAYPKMFASWLKTPWKFGLVLQFDIRMVQMSIIWTDIFKLSSSLSSGVEYTETEPVT